MEESIKSNNSRLKYLLKVSICFVLLLIFSLVQDPKINAVMAYDEIKDISVQSSEKEFCYLSDIPYVPNQSSAGWGQISMDKAGDGNLISVKVEGASTAFEKGIWAHATSTLVYDLTNYSEYDYFIGYVGLNKTAASSSNGVKFYIYTSVDGVNWELKTAEEPKVMKAGTDAEFVKVDIKNAKYLKLYADSNGSNGNDHSVYADAKLIKSTYKEVGEDLVPSLEELDRKIKTEFANADLTNKEYELAILQRKFISNVGNYALRRFLGESELNKETYLWLTNNVENLRLYMLGGAPSGGYYNSLKQLTRLLEAYKSDFDNKELINEGKDTKGNLYKRMAITLSLTHSTTVGLWMQPSSKENQSDAVERYRIYKEMYNEGKFKVTEQGKNNATQTIDITPWFESYNIEEMRWVLGTAIDDEEIVWLNEYTQSRIDKEPGRAWSYLTPHPYMAYVWPNYGNDVYYAEENIEYFDELFSVNGKGLFDYGITRGTPDYKLYKLWMNFRNKFGTGAVCGGISKSGHCIRGVNAIASAVIGQPGHAALLYYTRNSEGKGYWGIDNDVSGWAYSEKGERMPLGWGNDRTYVKGYNVPYIVLAQEALNDYNNLVKAEEILMTVDLYKGDKAKQEQIYREAIKVQSINLDAWAGLAKLYVEDSSKTEEDYYNLEKEMMEALKCFPFTMYNLSNYIKTKLTSDEYDFKFTILQTKILTEAKNYPSEGSKVLQPSLTRGLAAHLLGQIDTNLATFSFDGENSGKIILSDKFDGNGIRWDYSLDGKKTWNEVSSTAEDHTHSLTDEEIASITSENDIYVHIVGTDYSEENIYKIDIQESNGLPATLFANDLENRVVAVNLSTEWRYSEGEPWTAYSVASPNLTGDKTVQLRQGATGTKLASKEPVIFTFTEDNQPNTRKYIPVSHLTVHSVSTQATNNGGAATNAIDGNYNTRWHSAWNGTDTERFIVIKLDRAVCLSAVEYVPAGGGNGKILDGTVYGSMDGENWEELVSMKNLTYTNQANTIEDAITNTKSFEIEGSAEVQYVKIVADRATNGNWFTARAFNFYQDLTKNPHPTAGIGYSTTEPTNSDVVARLINLSSPSIKITNNNGSATYTFTENGEFKFEFIDEETNEKGSAIAKVNWIDKTAPTATIEYNITSKTNEDVEAKLIPSEDVKVLNNGRIDVDEEGNETVISDPFTYLFMRNGEFTFEFEDAAGNRGTATAKVDWITDEEDSELVFTSKKYKIEDDLISRIVPSTKVSEFKQNIETNQEIKVVNKDGTILQENEIVSTGSKVIVGEEEYTLVVTGDIDGNGKLTIKDLSNMKLHLIHKKILTDVYLKAADISGDGKVSLIDLSQMKLALINKLEIK